MIYSNKILIQLISFRHILHNLYLQKLSKFIESFKHLYNLLHGLGNAKWRGGILTGNDGFTSEPVPLAN